MSARPLDLDVLSSRLLTLDERDALIHYCRTARAALVAALSHAEAALAERPGNIETGCVVDALRRALRDLDAIAGDGA